MNKIATTLTALLLAICAQAAAPKAWVDVTDKYIRNPRFDGNDYWSYWEGTQFGAAGPHENAEHYQRNYDTYQNLSGLTPGKYRLSLSAFYRMGEAGDDYRIYSSGNYSENQHAKLYASSSKGTYQVSIAPSSSAALSESLGGNASEVGNRWNRLYIPNNMQAAYFWFEAGYYKNTVQCEVGEDGNLRIGVRKDVTVNGDWTCLDNWKLEVYTEINPVTSITFDRAQIEMVIGQILTVEPIIAPADATIQTVTWKTNNDKVLSVDKETGEIVALAKGSATVSAVATDGSLEYGNFKVDVLDNDPSSENIIINEIMAQNIDVYLDPNQNYGSWVELYNPTDRSVNLEGLYVTDDRNNLKKHKLVKGYGTLTAGGYAILNFDHHEVWTPMSYRQIDDKLDCDGGTIIISDGTTIFAEQEYPASIGRISYARTTDGGDKWGYTGNPTPAKSNAESAFANEQLEAPVVDKDAQLFNGSMQITVSFPVGSTLKYTTDGTTPTLTNGEVSETGIFNINSTETFRFRVFKDGYLPSTVVTRSYITNDGNNPFPIISIVTDPDNIYSNNHGAFMTGQYGRPGNGRDDKCNWNMDWDHPVNFEFITTDNECVVSQECDFSMCGGWSRAYTPHSFKLKANKIYDLKNSFDYQFFEDKPGLKHKTLQIRNGGNDTGCRITDAALQGIMTQDAKFYIDYQAWQPVRVFINGQHYAVLNMREPNNKHHAYANYGIDSDEMDQFEMSPDSGYVQMEGTKDSFDRWYELSKTATKEESYEEIKTLVDIDEYINYMACEFYAGGTDWPQNNVKGFRDRNNGKFHFVIFDLDFALGTNDPFENFFGKKNFTFDKLRGYDYSRNVNVQGQQRLREIQFVTIFENMLKNNDFRRRFIDAYCIVNGSLFDPERVQKIVNERASYLATGGYVNPWSSANNLANSYNSYRQSSMISKLIGRQEMALNSAQQFTANLSSDLAEAEILINDQPLPTSKLNGVLFSPVTIKATAPAGYKFKGWRKGTSSMVASTIFETTTSWKYYDKGSLDGTNWTASNYNDDSWKSGAAPLGYGKTQTTTTESKRPTYYFRKTFTLSDAPKTTDDFELNFNVDDGWIIYINGVEAERHNMPSGYVGYDSYSSTYADGQYDNGTATFKSSLFKKGQNVIAVEVHNNNSTSSDIFWSAELIKNSLSTSGTSYAYTDSVIHINSPKNISYIAEWEKITDEEMIAEGLNTTPVVINEVSASNSVYVNDYYKKNDWIELYNNSSDDVDIAGLYISDNLDKPTKYKVPENDVALNTVIPAHGYKVIWCDKLDNISDVIHTSFKLGAEGGDIIILKRDAEGNVTYSDTITYIEHLGQQSFGRYPDAGTKTYVMDKPTPGKANIYTTYAVEYVKPIPEPEPDAIAIVRDGGMTIAYVNGVVNVKSEDYTISSVNVFNASGSKVAGNIIRSNGSFVSINVSTLRTGIYVATATNTNGDECKIKFVVK